MSMETNPKNKSISPGELNEFCVDVLTSTGVSAEHAKIAADLLVLTDAWGIHTHGMKLLPGYVKRIRAGGIRTDREPSIASEGPAWAIVDGCSVLGQVASAFAMRAAIGKARASGIGYAGVRNSNHFGAAGPYAALAAREGMIGMAMSNDIPSVAAPGSRKAITGSNPISYAVPAGRHNPILLDMATSTVAGGKVYAARVQGKPIPGHWLIGPDGLPTTDGNLYPQSASLAPVGGHKGYGIALLIETLSAILPGSGVTWGVGSWIFGDPALPTDHGSAFLAFDVGAMGPREAFLERVDALIDEIHKAPTAPGVERVLVPGEREWECRRKALEDGIELPAEVIEALRALARDLGIESLWQ